MLSLAIHKGHAQTARKKAESNADKGGSGLHCISAFIVRLPTFITLRCLHLIFTFTALTLLVGWQEGHPACKKTEWWGAGVVICLEQDADLHTAQLMPLPLTISCFS